MHALQFRELLISKHGEGVEVACGDAQQVVRFAEEPLGGADFRHVGDGGFEVGYGSSVASFIVIRTSAAKPIP